jgi:tRNA ligase
MDEFKYYDVPSPFPSLVRGLFTTKPDEGEVEGRKGYKHRIVIRGYDKFFNIGEVPWTTVRNTFCIRFWLLILML